MRNLSEKICRAILLSLLLPIILQFAFVLSGYSEDNGIFLFDYNPQQYAANNSLATSTHAVKGIMVSYMIYPVGSTCTYHLAFTTASFVSTSNRAITDTVVTSSEATIPANFILSDTVKINMVNPKIVISGLATGATVYVWMDYGVAKTSWGGN